MYDYIMRENQRSMLLEAANHHLVRQSQLARLNANQPGNQPEKPRSRAQMRVVSYRALAWLGRQFTAWGDVLQDRYEDHQEEVRAHSRYYGRV
ncbi:MAG: hypothetical protein H7175_26490 [Burkholderiales bacterium]|nr:hypothetical protein [Anaerolineae bacterium]